MEQGSFGFVDLIPCIGVRCVICVRLHANCLPISIHIMFRETGFPREICSGIVFPLTPVSSSK